MDGLIIDSEPFWRQAEISKFGEVGIALTEEDCKKTMGMRINEVVAYWYERFPWETISQEEVVVNIVDEMERLIRTHGKALPGVIQALEICKRNGLKIALASSSQMQLIKATLETLSISEWFDVVRSAETELYGKPHPAVFMRAAEAMNIAPQHCVIFEDSFHGVIAGLAARSSVVAVPDEKDVTDPRFKAATILLSSLNEFTQEILQSL